jgi:hypothetical protein
MFREDIEPNMTPRLEAAVGRAYDGFAGYVLTNPLIYCDCNVCMSDQVAAPASTLPSGSDGIPSPSGSWPPTTYCRIPP